MVKRVITAAVLALLGVTLATGADGSGCKEQPAPHSTRKVKPAPNPDPAPSRRGGIGNVELVFHVETSSKRLVVSWNVGRGFQHGATTKHVHDWVDTAKPGQHVVFIANHSAAHERAWITIEVVQRNNGLILCRDNNDEDPTAGAQCDGIVRV